MNGSRPGTHNEPRSSTGTRQKKNLENPESEDNNSLDSQIDISTSKDVTPNQSFRPKRDAKKKFDQNFVSFGDQEVINSIASKKKESGFSSQMKYQKISENQDPVHLMHKNVLQPIIQFDKLQMFQHEMREFDIELQPKDLKQVSKKEEMITQRVYIEPNDAGSFDIIINLDPNFERYTNSNLKEEVEEVMTPIEKENELDNSNLRQSECSNNVSADLESPDLKDKKCQKKRKR